MVSGKITLKQIDKMRQDAIKMHRGGRELRRLKAIEKFIKIRDESDA